MMKLSTLWNIDSTVNASGSSPVAEAILAQWEHDKGSIRFFRSSTNFIYVFLNAGERYFLRFADSSERSKATIEGEIDILTWLAEAEMRVAMPIRSRNGNFVETTVTEHGVFHAVVFRGLAGAQVDIEALDDAQFRTWGAALGHLHTALRTYTGPGLSARSTWRDQLAWARGQIPEGELAVRHELNQLTAALDALPMKHDTYGLIHYDFELDNLVWRDGSIAMLDFDDCAHCWYVADIAFALRDLFVDGVDLRAPALRAFVRGYATQCSVDEEMLSLLPTFLRMGNLLHYVRLMRTRDLPEGPYYPVWLEALDLKLKRRQEGYRVSLVGQAD